MADLFQCVAVTITQPIPQFDNLSLAVTQAFEHLGDPVAKHLLSSTNGWVLSPCVGKQVAKMAVFTVAHRTIEADWIATHGRYPPRFVYRRAGPGGDLFDRRLAPVFLEQLSRHVSDARHCLNHVHGDPDRATLIRHCASDGLSNPPRGIRAKLEASAVFKLIHRPHESGIAFLNEIQKREAAVAVLFSDGHNQPEIPFGEPAFCLLIVGINLLDFH